MELTTNDQLEEIALLQSIAHIGSWHWNLQTNERSWSDEFYRICGLPPGDEQINAETAIDFIHPDDRENVVKAVNNAIENQIPYKYEKRIVRPDGEVRHIIAKGKAAYDQKGEPLKMFGTMQDITEQKEAELQLQENEARNKAMLEAIPDLMVVFNKQGVYLDAQAPDSMMLLKPKHELIGKHVSDILPKEVGEKIILAFAKVEKTKQSQILEYSFPVRGDLRYYETRVVAKGSGDFLAISRDITESKRAEKVIQENEERFRLAMQAGEFGSWDWNLLTKEIVRDKYQNALFGMNPENHTVTYESFMERVHPEDREELKFAISEAIQNTSSYTKEYRVVFPDKSMHWLKEKGKVFKDANGKPSRIIGVTNDISIRRQKELFKGQLKNIVDMIIHHEPLKHIGDKIVETIEKTVPICMGSILLLNKEKNKLHKLSAPNLPKTFSNGIEGVAIGPNVGSCGTAAYFKKEIVVADIANDPLWEDFKKSALAEGLKACWSFPILSSEHEVLGILSVYSKKPGKPLTTEREVIADVIQVASVAIEHHNISAALKNSKEKLAAYAQELENKVAERTNELKDMVQKLTESNFNLEDQVQVTKAAENRAIANQIMFLAIAKNFPKGIIIVVNSNYVVEYIAGEELEKMKLKEFAFSGTSIDDISVFSKERKIRLKQDIRKTLTGEHLTFDIELENNTYTLNTTPLFDENKKIIQALLVYNNISDKKQVELKILNALKKEQELSELKSRFVSMASHEFRTPLSTILSGANLIERQNAPGKEDKRIKYVDRIKSSVKNLVVILNDFLSLSKLEEGKVVAKPTSFDLVDFSESLIEEIQGIKKNGQDIEFIHDQSSMEVFLDPKLLRHITHNLLSNAIKYSEENKVITYKISGSNNKLHIEVVDQGIGIPVEEHGNMFQRFYRADNASNMQGTGLGLNIVKQYTELMGGVVSFKSTLNQGTSFLVELPLKLKDKK